MRQELSAGGDGGLRAGLWPEARFEAVFFQYYSCLVGVLYRMLGNRAQAEELASDAFLKLYQRASAEESYGNVGGWLYRTATRLGLDALRSLQRRQRYEPGAGEEMAVRAAAADPLESVLRDESARAVRAALAKLKPQQARILTLRASGLSYKELAQALGVKTASVGQLLVRAEAAFEKAYRKMEGKRHVL